MILMKMIFMMRLIYIICIVENKENKIAISAVNDNPRAKLIPVDKFGIEENWNIELFWSDEEKIELGIKKERYNYVIRRISRIYIRIN